MHSTWKPNRRQSREWTTDTCSDTRLKDVSPLSACDGCPQGLLKEKACLCLWEVPNHLGPEILTAQPCNDTARSEHMQQRNVGRLKPKYLLSVSQMMKLYSEVASMT